MVRHKKASSVSRLAIHSNIEVEDYQLHEFQNLRSLLFRMKFAEFQVWDINLISINFGIFKSLKILRLEGFKFKNGLPNGIENLILLKHFSIENSEVAELPASICKLPCLQSSNLETFFGAIKLPNSILKIRRLRHLYLNSFGVSVIGGGKLRFDGLNELETLCGFESSIINAADVIKLPKLRLLHGRICDEESLSMIVDCILNRQDQFQETSFIILENCDMINSEVDVGSKCLLSRTLMCRSLSLLEIECHLNKLPSYEHQLGRNLLRLCLSSCYIMEDPKEMLEKLPMLRELELNDSAFVGREMVCGANGFPQLKRLLLMSLPNLVEWRVEEKAMPNLSFLYINSCNKLEKIPDGPRFINTLKKLSISQMPGEFTKRVRAVDGQAGEDYHKIKHISSITIDDKELAF